MSPYRPVISSLATPLTPYQRRSPVPQQWLGLPALEGFAQIGQVLSVCSNQVPAQARRPVLAALLVLAPSDRTAAALVMAALTPGLRAVAGELSRWGVVPVDEVDAIVVLSAWEAVCSLGGRDHAWPDRAVLGRARDGARSQLRALARRHRRERVVAHLPEPACDPPGAMGALGAVDLLRRAAQAGVISTHAAGLIWATRVEGRDCAELAAASGRAPEAVCMERLRAERAMRAMVA